MIKGKIVLAVIPARGGSKRLPRKNIKELAGKPLIAWTIEEAKKSKYIDKLILSSEDEEIINVAKMWGCEVPFKRPKKFAQDDTPGVEPVLHVLQMLPGYDYVVLLQPTSPLRTVEDIDGCLMECIVANSNSCISVTEAEKSPFWMYTLTDEKTLQPIIEQKEDHLRRQENPMVYVLNGAVYIARCDWLMDNKSFRDSKTMAYVMPKKRSIDVDEEIDFKMAESLLREY